MTILGDDEKYMVEALKEAVKAYSEGKFPWVLWLCLMVWW